jgi:uncharacterized protein (DUF1330 family)
MAELTIVVLLFVRPGREREFERFEARAVRIMSRYGGRIERRVGFPAAEDASTPHEMHVLSFPDRDAFERYRRDPDVQAVANERAEAIRDTVVWYGADRPPSFAEEASSR